MDDVLANVQAYWTGRRHHACCAVDVCASKPGKHSAQSFAIRGACPTGQTHPQALCRASVVDWQLSDTLLLLRVVGQDDELYEQSDSDNDASELVYDEFAECVVRLADAIHGEGTKSNKVVKGKLVYAHKQSAVEVEG